MVFDNLTARIKKPKLIKVKFDGAGSISKLVLGVLLVYAVVTLVLGVYWSITPEPFDVRENAAQKVAGSADEIVIGATTTAALITVAETLLDKPGGYLSNDISPPGLYLDNTPNWEFGVLVQIRDLARAMREHFSRSQSQSIEDTDLARGEPLFNFSNDSWFFPPTEGEYRDAIAFFESYLIRISDRQNSNAQFFSRADNLTNWLLTVESRLGSLSQRLSASIGQRRLNTDTAGDQSATQSTPTQSELLVKTPWLQLDDVFYEARGATWALTHFLKAVAIDFANVLEDKNAVVSLRQIIRELEASQRIVISPVILNGSGFGIFANHSLVMANYVSRANAAIIDLRNLLTRG